MATLTHPTAPRTAPASPALVDFTNTSIAFESQSNTDLARSVWLFKTMGNPALVKWGAWAAEIGFSLGLPIKGLVRGTIYKQFVGGETIDACEATIRQLAKYHVGTILDYSVEGEEEEKAFEACFQELKRTVLRAAGDPAIPFSVFKVTGLGLSSVLEKVSQKEALNAAETEAWERLRGRVMELCTLAATRNVRIFIDAEESWIQPAIDDLALEAMRLHNKAKALVYNTFQMYRHDRRAYFEMLLELSAAEGWHLGGKIVRGAYMEKERARAAEKGYRDPIQPNKGSTDRDYDAVLALSVMNADHVAICAGTHNEASSQLLMQLMDNARIDPTDERFYFSQLLGMSDNLSFNLAHGGYRVAKYVPYGPVRSVLPYLVRRAQENTSIAGQVGRELAMLKSEKERRAKGQGVK